MEAKHGILPVPAVLALTNWYKAVRRIFNLPPLCHRRFVAYTK